MLLPEMDKPVVYCLFHEQQIAIKRPVTIVTIMVIKHFSSLILLAGF